jgi:hypothetical protein
VNEEETAVTLEAKQPLGGKLGEQRCGEAEGVRKNCCKGAQGITESRHSCPFSHGDFADLLPSLSCIIKTIEFFFFVSK